MVEVSAKMQCKRRCKKEARGGIAKEMQKGNERRGVKGVQKEACKNWVQKGLQKMQCKKGSARKGIITPLL